MGFKVLVCEQIFADTYRLQFNHQTREEMLYSQMFGDIYVDKDYAAFLEYLYAENILTNPERYIGIDLFYRWPEVGILKYYTQQFSKIDPAILQTEQWQQFYTNVKNIYDIQDSLTYQKFKGLIDQYSTIADQTDKLTLLDKKYLKQMLKNNLGIARFYLNYQADKEYTRDTDEKAEFYRWRDKQMADNLLWVLEELAPTEKVIVFTSTYHISRNIEEVARQSPAINQARPMGDYVWQKYKNDIYSIAFVTHHGLMGLVDDRSPLVRFRNGKKVEFTFPKKTQIDSSGVMQVPPLPFNSIESILNGTGGEYGFLDLSQPTKGGEWLKAPNPMFPTFERVYSTDWSKVYDGLFFIRQMQPKYRYPVQYYLFEQDLAEIEINIGFGIPVQNSTKSEEKEKKKKKRRKNKS